MSKNGNGITRTESLVNQLNVDDLPRKGSRQYCELVTKKQGGDPFIRRIVVNGHPYWQKCQWVYLDGERKLKIIEHLGSRKPRAAKIKRKGSEGGIKPKHELR